MLDNLFSKIIERHKLNELIATWKTNNQKIVFTNGCFDLIHQGHVQYLYQARLQGDKMIVALNSDQSIQKIKGSKRPIVTLQSRMEVMAGFFFVDAVISFEEETPYNLIEMIKPDILIKGGDYNIDAVIGKDIVEKNNGHVAIIPEIEGAATTTIIKKILENYQGGEE